jgi:tetratricopeptide (TPR) repeat protein
MNHLRYRLETLPAALNAWKMPRKSVQKFKQRSRVVLFVVAGLLVGAAVVQESRPPTVSLEAPAASTPAIATAFLTQLADARIDTAKAKLEQNRPDEALALLVSALKGNPGSSEARALADVILSETTWSFPELTLKHPMPVDQLATADPAALWVSLGGKNNTTVRWNLDRLKIESVLFPTNGGPTRSLVFDPTHRSVVIERKSLALLCDAQTLKPIRDLGRLPDDLTPSSVIVFSPDGLLMAHPESVSEQDQSVVWHIRDSATGEIIRTTEPSAPSAPRPLAAFVDRQRLRVLTADGSLAEIPVSPVEPVSVIPMEEPVKLLQAQFAANGNSILTLRDLGPHQSPDQSIISYGEDEDQSLETDALALRFPWSRHPNMWTGLMKDPKQLPFEIEGNSLKILTNPHAPMQATSPVTALAFARDRVFIGEENGVVTAHRLLPLPEEAPTEREAEPLNPVSLRALENLATALAGRRYDETERDFPMVGAEERVKAFKDCDFDAILAIFPHLDFSALIRNFRLTPNRAASPEGLLPLTQRLANAAPPDKSAPGLTAVKDAFHSGDSAAVTAAIQAAGGKGPAMATALALALNSENPEWIDACLSQAVDLPPLLRQISRSRIAWLQGRKADALSPWPEVFPDLWEIRLREDWDGWEQADFSQALDNLSQCVRDELAAIRIPKDSTPEQRKAVADRLSDPATLSAVGKPRFALACMDAAVALSANKEELETTAKFASVARNLGAPAVPCLRAEALAFTALGDFQNARTLWVELITEHPVEMHLPGDYAEAAYTSFENADSQQAVEILTTGLRRFPQDANFALRAGWVALLTGNSERAYKFLLAGKRIGFPSEKLENATALLCIAASQAGAIDESSAYFDELLAIDPAWEEPETLEALDWPEELKSTLREFSLVTLTPDLLPEPFPTNP